jgi:DNA modification methylase
MNHKSSINSLINVALHCGDCLSVLSGMESGLVDCCVTSPPYFGLRDYGVDGQIGLESTPEEYVARMVEVFREVKRLLKDDGTLWLNIGDSYASMQRSGKKESPGVGAKQEMPPIRTKIRWGKGGGTNFFWRIPTEEYGDIKPKDLIGIPWMLAFALRADGWYLRQDIIWHKPNPMPESVKDRCTKAHEYVFLLSKSERYYFDNEAIKEPCSKATHERAKYRWKRAQNGGGSKESMQGHNYDNDFGDMTVDLEKGRNKRSVWTVTTKPYKGAHFATYPPALIEPCVLAGSRKGGMVLDPFNGSGTTGEVAILNGRGYVGIELNPEYIQLAEARIGTAVKQYESHVKQQEFDFGIAT